MCAIHKDKASLDSSNNFGSQEFIQSNFHESVYLFPKENHNYLLVECQNNLKSKYSTIHWVASI